MFVCCIVQTHPVACLGEFRQAELSGVFFEAFKLHKYDPNCNCYASELTDHFCIYSQSSIRYERGFSLF
jgi:hypothetical protein